MGRSESVGVVHSHCILIPANARPYHSRALSHWPWLSNINAIFWTVVRVRKWTTPNAFSCPANARSNHSNALSYCPWLSNTTAILWTVVRVSGWPTPNSFSLPANARPYHSSAFCPLQLNNQCNLIDCGESMRVVHSQ